MKLNKFLLSTLIFSIALLVIYALHIYIFSVNVILYSAIFDGFLAALLAFIIFLRIDFLSQSFNSHEKLSLFIIWILLGYIFAISIPTVIDRSLSFYILEKISQRGGGIKRDGFEDVFTKEYVKEHRLVDIRLTEQEESGTILIENGCVKLTNKGQAFVRFSRFFRLHFLPKKRLINGQYSDDLIDPFKNSNLEVDYRCK